MPQYNGDLGVRTRTHPYGEQPHDDGADRKVTGHEGTRTPTLPDEAARGYRRTCTAHIHRPGRCATYEPVAVIGPGRFNGLQCECRDSVVVSCIGAERKGCYSAGARSAHGGVSGGRYRVPPIGSSGHARSVAERLPARLDSRAFRG